MLQELLVVYRQTPQRSWFPALQRRLVGASEKDQLPRYRQRSVINMRIYRDVPMPIWKLVFPNKLLQFRPLDGLRADLLTVAGNLERHLGDIAELLRAQLMHQMQMLMQEVPGRDFVCTGLVAFIAQAKYDSIILELITLSSAVVLLVRVVLGYKRMNDRSASCKLWINLMQVLCHALPLSQFCLQV